MDSRHNFEVSHELGKALEHLRTAIAILDRANAPAQIAAHIDLATCQLQDFVEGKGSTQDSNPGVSEH